MVSSLASEIEAHNQPLVIVAHVAEARAETFATEDPTMEPNDTESSIVIREARKRKFIMKFILLLSILFVWDVSMTNVKNK